MLFGGTEVIVARVLDGGVLTAVLLGTTVLLGPELAVELGAFELVTLGRLDDPEGTAELLPVADPEAAEVPSTLGRPVTTTDVGWSG